MESSRCKFWLPKKNRFCANVPLTNTLFCGNHTSRSDSQWIACPIDPSHTVLEENLQGHLRRCPLLKHVQSLSTQPFYQMGTNAGTDEEEEEEKEKEEILFRPMGVKDCPPLNDLSSSSGPLGGIITSEMKRNAVYTMTATQLSELISKIQSVHASICRDIQHSYKIPKACSVWINRQVDGKLPFQEKHVMQQASILGNLEEIGVLRNSGGDILRDHYECDESSGDDTTVPAVVEFGAGRGYLTQLLADCYGIKNVFLVERKSYKLKADRSLRQKERLILERLRIDIEDLNLNAVESLQGIPYLGIGKHLCGPATDMTLRCCLAEQQHTRGDDAQCSEGCHLGGLAIATCCHHLCQWKHYINKKYLTNLGISKEDFHAITWFTSWAVDADHSSDLSGGVNCASDIQIVGMEDCGKEACGGVEDILRDMKAVERAVLGFRCKDIIDMGRLMWLKEHEELEEAKLVEYVPSHVSPENHLLVAKGR
ncbi:tRNA:m(4)X modification enzyme TRM13 [Camellia lanceoleosa]|uniref:tRNA:m(4)X modification enzyme TRM13 n=1 Tax=Camellia lanceoleosa TaxID=1840588 RepID=A0ACC0F413_9ERIC|nr:tRNA:m(4)X modification enzyme TRM13 [Camellia lanceoleosa]